MIHKCNEHGYFRQEVCPYCGKNGIYILDNEREERLGRFISGALRHFPEDLGLTIDKHGWININSLCHVMKNKYPWAKKQFLFSLIESDLKNRYELKSSNIRARYGHSIDIDLDYPESKLSYYYYGVSQEEVDVLLEMGITPIRQRYVHLSTSTDKATESSSIHTENPVILKINADEARNDGLIFIVAHNDIVLTDSIPPDYLSVVEADK